MSEVWETKDGLRRVRRDPPTIEDAVLAAQGLTEELDGQVEIVVALMAVPAEEARRARSANAAARQPADNRQSGRPYPRGRGRAQVTAAGDECA